MQVVTCIYCRTPLFEVHEEQGLCTSRLALLNVPMAVRTTIFDRCWSLIHDEPPPTDAEHRLLDLRPWNEVTLEAMVEVERLSTATLPASREARGVRDPRCDPMCNDSLTHCEN